MFRSLINWLSKRFPEQLTVSVQEYKEMREELGQYNIAMQAVNQLNERLVALEAQVKRLNDSKSLESLLRPLAFDSRPLN